ncbi:MAG: hypothetical protein ACPMAQ_10595 [Phycisphaerae bacterium]
MSTIGSLGGLAAYNPGVLNGVNVASPLASGTQLPGAVQGSSSAETVSTGMQATALSSSSQTMSAQMESMIQVTNAVSNGDMVNALLLLLAMKLLSDDQTDEKDKKTMAALLLLAAGLGQQQQSSTIMYQSMSVSMSQSDLSASSVSIGTIQTGLAQSAYATPAGGGGSPALDVSA